MMKSFLLIAIISIASFGFSQSSHDDRLLEKYSEKELTELKTEQPEEYQVLVNALERGIFIGEIPTQKGKDVQFDGELDIDPSGDHTFISLGIELKETNYQYFKIKGTNMLVGVLPKSLLK
ncbi:MAG: hypothetical protein COA32_02550 [Fluviicola sp.]|nr:MAG: hypothetical protein COA32_02550 [Fluviicola sp.]